MKFKKIILLLFSILFLFSCSGAKDALQGKKRSDTSDEFLVEKKNPLTVPPDINELPVPLDQEEQDQANNQEDIDIKKVLKIFIGLFLTLLIYLYLLELFVLFLLNY